MKVSVVITVLNEVSSIVLLLDSLEAQTVKPDEVVIVDAGSDDGTVETINAWGKKHKSMKLRLLVKEGVNRSVGRNEGIRMAANGVIAFVDAGCVVEKDWLELLGSHFQDKSVESVAGFYRPVFENEWGQVFSWFTSVMEDDFDADEYLPSARSLAVRKEVMDEMGGFPEELDTCEDLLVAAALKKRGSMMVEQKAVVMWKQEDGLVDFFNQIAGYAEGDVAAGYAPHMKKIWLVFLRYLMFLLVWPLFVVYLAYPIYKFRRRVRTASLVLRSVVVQLVADIAVMWGAMQGWLGKV